MVFLEFINFDIVNVDEGNKNDGTIVEVLLYFMLCYIWGPTWQAVAHFQGMLRLCADFPQVRSRSWRLLCFRALEVIAWWQTELNMFEVPAGMSWRTAKITKLNKQTGPGPKPTFQRACVTYQLVLGSSMGILVLRNVTELGRPSVIHWGYSEGMLNYRKHMWHAVKIWGGEKPNHQLVFWVCVCQVFRSAGLVCCVHHSVMYRLLGAGLCPHCMQAEVVQADAVQVRVTQSSMTQCIFCLPCVIEAAAQYFPWGIRAVKWSQAVLLGIHQGTFWGGTGPEGRKWGCHWYWGRRNLSITVLSISVSWAMGACRIICLSTWPQLFFLCCIHRLLQLWIYFQRKCFIEVSDISWSGDGEGGIRVINWGYFISDEVFFSEKELEEKRENLNSNKDNIINRFGLKKEAELKTLNK